MTHGAPSERTLWLAGDALLVRPWSQVADPRFLRLVEAMRAADVTIVNLETVLHDYGGHPQAESGGTWCASPPAIARELAWAGVDMVAHANNHAFDYGALGVLETLRHAAEAGLALAGSGRDLAAARAPAYSPAPEAGVALVACAADFVPYGRASPSRPDLHGRPGVNPLRPERAPGVRLTPKGARRLERLSRALGFGGDRFRRARFSVAGVGFRVGSRPGLRLRPGVSEEDLRGNRGAIREAVAAAPLVVVSVHAHRQGGWLRRFARRASEWGAAVVFAHGPHALRGIELHRGRPIFYGLGDFAYQTHLIERLPPEYYEAVGLDGQADRTALAPFHARAAALRELWEGAAAEVAFSRGGVRRIRLWPLDLGFGEADATRGLPRLAEPELGRRIVAEIARRSRRYGTRVRYDPATNTGEVALS